MKNGIVCFVLGLLVLLGGLGVGYLISHNEDNVLQNPLEEKSDWVIQNDEKARDFIAKEFKFLQVAFPYSLKERDTIKNYEDFESRKNIADAYVLKTDFDLSKIITKEEENGFASYISFEDFKIIYDSIFNTDILKSDIPESYLLEDNYIYVFLPTGFGVNIPVYWKTEYNEKEGMYRLYYVDFATRHEYFSEVIEKYSVNSRVLDENDLEKYKPSVTILSYKKNENNYNLLKCEYVFNYNF